MGLLSRIFQPSAAKAVEGEYRPGPYHFPISGGWLSADVGQHWNWWQMGHDLQTGGNSAMVEACVSAYSQTVAMCPGDHWHSNAKDGRDRVTTSALSRILRKPNDYQSISDFLLNLTRNLYTDGNAYALCLRNDRYEITELHLMRSTASAARISIDGDVFYELHGNQIIDQRIPGGLVVPARDVLHVRLHTPEHPLIGVSPLVAAAMEMAVGNAMLQQQMMFYVNQARPSTVLTTDLQLTKQQVDDLRDIWNKQSRGLGTGGTPILTSGLKPATLSSTARDAQLAELMKMADQNIALAYRVPLQILGIGGTPFASTELLMQFWLAGGLNFCLNHIEEAVGQTFQLKGVPDDYLELNTAVLLRSALRDRVESYAVGTRAGIFAPNEARAEFELDRVKDGDEPRMQQQDVPLSYGAELEPPDPNAAKPAALPAPAADAEDQPDEKSYDSNAILGRIYDHASLH
jgi:HK97 family phage portal protein